MIYPGLVRVRLGRLGPPAGAIWKVSGNPTPFTSPPFFVICLSYACHTNIFFISLVDLSS